MTYPEQVSTDPEDLLNGERETGTDLGDFPKDHLARYLFAQSLLGPDADVLDIGCGVGYGSHVLAQKAAHVTGIDYRPRVIEYAQAHWSGSNQDFICGDALQEDTYPDRTFSLITAFEVIEHLPDDHQFLSLVSRHLKPDGILCVSAPNLDVLPNPEENPWHFRHYLPDQFRALLNNFFSSVALLTQLKDDVVTGEGGRTNFAVAYNRWPHVFRLAFVSQEYPAIREDDNKVPLSGGIGTYTRTVARGLAARGHEVHVISRSANGNPQLTYHDGAVTVHRVKDRFDNPARVRRLAGILTTPLARMLGVRRYLNQPTLPRFDLIESAEWRAETLLSHAGKQRNAAWIARLHVPTFVTLKTVDQPLGWQFRWLAWAEKLNAHLSDGITAPSRALASICNEQWRLGPIEFLPNPMETRPDSTFVSPTPVRKVGYFPGRFDNYKGFPLVANALSAFLQSHNDALRIILVGRSSASDGLQPLLKKLEPWVDAGDGTLPLTILPRQDHSSLEKLMNSADAVLVASRFENMPYAILEAMAAGKLVVATRVGGIPEMIEDGVTGFLFEPDPLSLVDCLQRILSMDAEQIAAIRRAAQDVVAQRYSLDHLLPTFEVYYTHLISRKRSGVKRSQPIGWWLPQHGPLVPGWLRQLNRRLAGPNAKAHS